MKSNYPDLALLLVRVSFSFSLITIHGLEKISMLLNGEYNFPDPLGIGGFPSLLLITITETICPLLIIVGYQTKYATLPIIMAMLIAGLIFHAADPFADRELAYVYMFTFLTIFLAGPGKYSIDQKIGANPGIR